MWFAQRVCRFSYCDVVMSLCNITHQLEVNEWGVTYLVLFGPGFFIGISMNNTIQEASVLRSPSSPTLRFIMDNLSLCTSTAFSLTMRCRWATVLVHPWDVSLGQLDFLCMYVCVSNSTSKFSWTCLRCAISCPLDWQQCHWTPPFVPKVLCGLFVQLCMWFWRQDRFACTHVYTCTHVSMSSIVSSSQRPQPPLPKHTWSNCSKPRHRKHCSTAYKWQRYPWSWGKHPVQSGLKCCQLKHPPFELLHFCAVLFYWPLLFCGFFAETFAIRMDVLVCGPQLIKPMMYVV